MLTAGLASSSADPAKPVSRTFEFVLAVVVW
jgi:hypothetical protein